MTNQAGDSMSALVLVESDIRTPERLSRVLRDHRRNLGLTQAETARRAGVSAQWLSEFENGRVPGGTAHVTRILDVLGLSIALHHRPRTLADQVLEEALQIP